MSRHYCSIVGYVDYNLLYSMQNDKEKKTKAKPKLPSRGVKQNLEADIDWLPTSQPETSRQRKLLSTEKEAMMLKMAKQAFAKNKSLANPKPYHNLFNFCSLKSTQEDLCHN